MPKTQITESMQLQIATAFVMISFRLLGLPESVEYAGYAATILIAAFAWFKRHQDKKSTPAHIESIIQDERDKINNEFAGHREIITKLMSDLTAENLQLHEKLRRHENAE